METDPYGFCHDLERGAARVLTKTGLAALIKEARERFDKAGTIKPNPAGSFFRDTASARRRRGAALRTLYVAPRELERLADLLLRSRNEALEGLSHHTTQPAAKRLENTYPDVAARLWCAQGMRIVNAKKSKYYDAALSNFERARRCCDDVLDPFVVEIREELGLAWVRPQRTAARMS